MFCSKCGKEIPDNVSFCPNCGAPTKPDEAVKAEPVDGTIQRSALAAGLLGIFLGCWGVHNFYLGYTGKAVGQLILGLTVVGLPVSAIWGLIEGILILTGEISVDGQGKPIKRDI